ncbi:hypothetical protein [Aeromicrobium wangtongii]|uniref:DUF998 domain-containing protein n=1 Tax=Aeromicrobium wangtongii TaxID=2969247 RepID=A0ABY5M8F7_9ACTN|nr:hypothetical protein [Aeromicrobium wangtongii]MCD9198045.1 hypothetical protein [Aeromicrobium wangtongii]UUP12086.1 hypothetical protein NQV15_09455 [Aeromicrobium wangtongii]
MTDPRPGRSVETYRFLRLAMVVLVVLLLTAVLRERLADGTRCFETTISAYYFTPVQGVFTASLGALGVCMIVIKAADGAEDLALAIGGMLAVVVGLVPTSERARCTASPLNDLDVAARVDNNVWSALLAGAVGVIVAALVAQRRGQLSPMTRRHRSGLLVTAALLLTGVVWFVAWRDGFIAHVHNTAAIGLFASVVAVVALNAWECRSRDDRRTLSRRYLVVLTAMIVLGGGLIVARWFGFEAGLLAAEVVVIALFAAFWLVQTDELWDDGPRPPRDTGP